MAGCAAQSRDLEATSQPADQQIGLKVATPPGGVQVEVEGKNPLVYTAFRLPEPPRLIIDLAGVNFSPDQQPMTVNHGAVTTVKPVVDAAGGKVARIEIGLTQLVDYQLRPDGTRLLITVSDPPGAATGGNAAVPQPASAGDTSAVPPLPSVVEPAAPKEPAPVMAETTIPAVSSETKPEMQNTTPSPARPSNETTVAVPDATSVTAIQVKQGSMPLEVTIQGNGRFHPEAMLLDGPRLVIDLPGATSHVLQPKVSVNGPLLKQIRVGQHRDPVKVRLVFDLTQSVNYRFDQKGDVLSITLVAMDRPSDGRSGGRETKVEPHPVMKSPVQTNKPADPEMVAPPAPIQQKKMVSAQIGTQNGNGDHASVSVGPKKSYSGRLISLDFQDADLDNVLRLMADVSGLNVVVGEGVKGKVTVKLLNVPWDQALDLILQTHGLGQAREGNILRIDTLANLSRQQDDEAKAKESATKAEDLVTRVMYVNYADAKKLLDALKKTLSPRGDLTLDERTNTLIVKDVEKKTLEVAGVLKVLDAPTPQVVIEARIVAADSNFARDLGVQWGGTFNGTKGPYQFGTTSGPSGSVGAPVPGFLVNLPAAGQAGPVGNVGFTFGRLTSNPFMLDLRLSAGENQGISKTISAPKIAVLNNQDAKIEQGTSIPFSTVSQSGTQTTFVDATLTLEVTPHITPDGSILMKLRVADDEPDYANRDPITGAPPIKKKEAKTNIMVKDGETAVLGGIYISVNTDRTSGVPFFYKIPGLGWLFKQNSKSTSTQELLVFLTPKIMS
jgi:type IV pilus assembly protein PilQ